MLSLVERDGRVRSFHVPNVTAQTLEPIIVANVNKATYLMTDDSPVYPGIGAGSPGTAPSTTRSRNMSAPFLAHQHGRELLLDLQARRVRLLLSRQRSASAPLRRRVRFQAQQPDRAWRR